MRTRVLLLLGVAFVGVFGSVAHANAQSVWTGLVVARKVPEPEPTPAELGRLKRTLDRLFGYNQYEVIGETMQPLSAGDESWAANSKYFSLRVDARGRAGSGYKLSLHLMQEGQQLLETEASLTKSSPLVIKGPFVGDGQLLLVLVLQ